MPVLWRKLWRTISLHKGQLLAMAAVITVGISLYISVSTAYSNLGKSQRDFYQSGNFAHYYFHVVKAPQAVTRQIEALPGIKMVSGRIQKDIPVIKDHGERATVRVTSFSFPIDKQVNKIKLAEGRWFEQYPSSGGIEALVDPQYYKANNIADNNTIYIVAENKKVPVNVVGSATGPEFIYAMKDASNLLPDPQTFGIVMIPHNQCQEIFNFPGQINQVIVQFNPGADEETIARQIEQILEPYGNLASYPRKDQLSHATLQAELDGGTAISRVLPFIFLGIAAAIQLVLLRRLIKTQRLQIGIMKALGYGNISIILFYSGLTLLVSLLGAILGLVLGLLFARYFSNMYAMFFNLPAAISGVNFKVIIYSFILSIGVGISSGLTASASIIKINPAESMRPQPPALSSRSMVEAWTWFWNKLGTSWKMSFRSISRNRLRFLVNFGGVTAAVALLLISFFINDAVDYMMDKHFNREISYDYLLHFNSPVTERELNTINRIEGIYQAEPFLEIPAKIHFADKKEDDLLIGQNPGNHLKSPFDSRGNPMEIPEKGILLSKLMAERLGVEVGATITVETALGMGSAHFCDLKVVGINQQLIGNNSYVSLLQANRIISETGLISGTMLKVDPGQADMIEQQLSAMTGISSIMSLSREKANIFSLMDSMIYFVGIMIVFSLVLGFAIIYNTAVMSFNERKRELAALLTLGFTRGEVSGLMFKETVIQALPGLIAGLPAGRLMAEWYISSIKIDFFTFPVVIYPVSYAFCFLIGTLFVFSGYCFAARSIKGLHMVELLKNID